MRTYEFALKHDNGTVTLRISADTSNKGARYEIPNRLGSEI